MKYRSIRDGINSTQKKALEWFVDIDSAKIICFSDHHRGKRDGADDFLPCEETYKKALRFYLQHGYYLILLGDVEELWECKPDVVMKAYQEVLDLEREFHLRQRLYRVWGNHDDLWNIPETVKLYFQEQFPNLKVMEAISMTITKQDVKLGNILWLHGHQGTLMSSRLAGLSKWIVQLFWRPLQRLFKVSLNTAANTPKLRYRTDKAMNLWASIRSRQLVVCGHTHQYLFGSLAEPNSENKPCYFNTGCCSYGNGNISGIEISRGKIRLVEWTPKESEAYYVATDLLENIFERCET